MVKEDLVCGWLTPRPAPSSCSQLTDDGGDGGGGAFVTDNALPVEI